MTPRQTLVLPGKGHQPPLELAFSESASDGRRLQVVAVLATKLGELVELGGFPSTSEGGRIREAIQRGSELEVIALPTYHFEDEPTLQNRVDLAVVLAQLGYGQVPVLADQMSALWFKEKLQASLEMPTRWRVRR